MAFRLLLIAPEGSGRLTQSLLDRTLPGTPSFLSEDAAECALPENIDPDPLRQEADENGLDALLVPEAGRRKKLLLADMDSTIVQGETLDDLAEFCGLGERISAITARAMNGELDFEEALKERVSLLAGRPESALRDVLDRMRLTPGAETLVRTMQKHGAYCVLVSGGFTIFTGETARRTGFDKHHGNTLEIADGVLTGCVKDPILDKNAKLKILNETVAERGLSPEDVLSVGDGANDLPMLQAAGMGIAFYPKPVVAAQILNSIRHTTLTSLLYAQGYERSAFQE